MNRRPLGFLGAWLVGCPGGERQHGQLSLRLELRDPPEGGDEAFTHTHRRAARDEMTRCEGYGLLAEQDAAHSSGSDTEPVCCCTARARREAAHHASSDCGMFP